MFLRVKKRKYYGNHGNSQIFLYIKLKLTDDVMDYLWSCIKQAEKDNVNNSNDYSHRLEGNISGSLGLKDVRTTGLEIRL